MKPAVFLHIQKTAGTSVRRIAARNYGGKNVCGHGEFLELGQEGCRRFEFVSGHFGIAFAEDFMKERYSFTFLRDPIERVVSLYTYLLTESPDRFPLSARAHECDLKQFLALADEPQFSPQLWNNQTWQLFHGWVPATMKDESPTIYMRDFKRGDPDAVVEQAIENLKRFDYVGFKESFAEDITTIYVELGAPEIDLHHSNPSKSSSLLTDMDAETLELARKINVLDQRLYDAARELYPSPRAPRVQTPPAKGHGLRRLYNKIFRPN